MIKPSTRKNSRKLISQNNFILVLFIIISFGILMVYDASSVYAQRLLKGDSFYFARLQFFWIIIGGFLFISFSKIGLVRLKTYSSVLFGLTILILGALALTNVLFPCTSGVTGHLGFFPCLNFARRWIYLNPPPLPPIPLIGIISFQASELAKFALVLFLPSVLERALHMKDTRKPFFYFVLICGAVSSLVLLEPNMSNAALIFVIGCVIYFVSGARLKYLLVLIPVMLILGVSMILVSPYRAKRLATYFSGESSKNSQSNESYQIDQISIALGRGGVLGVGLGQSKQKLSFTPEVYADSIFAILGEELGFLGTTFLVILFSLLVLSAFDVVSLAVDPYERMVGAGIAGWIYFQFLINVYAMVRLIPVTGMPIPLFSYGGSSMVFTLAALGVLYSIKRKTLN